MLEAIISQFGEDIGIPNLALNSKGTLGLSLKNVGNLSIERANSSVCICLVKPVEYPSAKLFWNALSLGSIDFKNPFCVNPICLDGNQIGFFIKVEEFTITLQQLRQAIDFLMNLHKKLAIL